MTSRPRLLLVTGMSGAGKSTVLDALEDMGWDCVDNLPVALLTDFADAATATLPGDEALLAQAQAAIESLEARHPQAAGAPRRF